MTPTGSVVIGEIIVLQKFSSLAVDYQGRKIVIIEAGTIT
jgi:hypothetical protein